MLRKVKKIIVVKQNMTVMLKAVRKLIVITVKPSLINYV